MKVQELLEGLMYNKSIIETHIKELEEYRDYDFNNLEDYVDEVFLPSLTSAGFNYAVNNEDKTITVINEEI